MPIARELHDFENAPDEFEFAMGKLTRRYGQVEHLLALIIHRATEEPYDQVFARFSDRRDLRNRKALIRAARQGVDNWARAKLGAEEAVIRVREFDRIQNQVKDALKRRDELTHCAWGEDPQGVLRATRHGSLLVLDGRPADQQHIQDTAETLWSCFKTLNMVCHWSQDPHPDPTAGSVESIYKITTTSTGAAAPDANITKVDFHT